MNLDVRKQNFKDKAKKYFAYLTAEYGYLFEGEIIYDWTDELVYKNQLADRQIILSNSYHPVDYGFEIQWYRPSVSIVSGDREMLFYKLK